MCAAILNYYRKGETIWPRKLKPLNPNPSRKKPTPRPHRLVVAPALAVDHRARMCPALAVRRGLLSPRAVVALRGPMSLLVAAILRGPMSLLVVATSRGPRIQQTAAVRRGPLRHHVRQQHNPSRLSRRASLLRHRALLRANRADQVVHSAAKVRRDLQPARRQQVNTALLCIVRQNLW
jgi:hypothetical protein